MEAKIKWLASLGHMTESPLMDSYGSEANRGLDALLETALAKVEGVQTSICSNPECPGGNLENGIGRIHLNIKNE